MLRGTVYIHGSHGSYWNAVEGSGKPWKVIEGDGRLWNLMEVSRKHKNVP